MRRKLLNTAKYFIAWGLVPLLLIAGAELGLRWSGYGITVRPFEKAHLDGEAVYNYAPSYFSYYADAASAFKREYTAPQVAVPARKAEGAYRIFVLGGSAAYGFAQPDFSVGRQLEVMVRSAYPGAKIEIYNTALIGMCSNIMADVAGEAARLLEPDLFLVYMGNNEFGGRFTMTANAWERELSPSLARLAIRAQLHLADLRMVQWLRHAWWDAAEGSGGSATIGVRPQEQLYALYLLNMEAICDAAESAGARVALCSVGYIRSGMTREGDVPPLNLQGEARDTWLQAYNEGTERQAAGDFWGAIESYQTAAKLEPDSPPLQQQLGHCLEATGQYEAASGSYERAIYAAALPPSASVKSNALVREVADAHPENVKYVGADEVIRAEAPHGIPGPDLFIDHCHLNFHSTYLIAASVYEQIAPALAERFGAPAVAGVPSEDACRTKLARTIVDDRATLRSSLESPFPKPESELTRRAVELDAAIAALPEDAEAKALDAALSNGWRSPNVLARRVPGFMAEGKPDEALALAEELRAASPYLWRHVEPEIQVLRSVGRADEALSIARGYGEDLLPGILQVQSVLADAAIAAGDLSVAERAARRAQRLSPESPSALDIEQRVQSAAGGS
ncbi:MAG: hypothetical protein GC168_11150 [Candidatus Hydrogenedens sp.]|nr:hypothetical protein [Candidatus Hydrogenedens sp.]